MAELLLSPDQGRGTFVLPSCIDTTVNRVRQVICDARNIALGTVDAEGDPYTTVLASGFAVPGDTVEDCGFMPDGSCLWWSYPDTNHSRNLARRPIGSIAVYNSAANEPSLLMKAHVKPLSLEEAADIGIAAYNEIRSIRGLPPRPIDQFDPAACKRPKVLYKAIPLRFSVGIPVIDIDSGRLAHSGEIQYPIQPDHVWDNCSGQYGSASKQMTKILLKQLMVTCYN